MTTEKIILVAGGAGYIGSHVCKALKLSGYQPVVYDNLSTGYAVLAKWGPIEIGDILNSERLDEVFRKYAPGAVIHLAALSSVAESIDYPDKYYLNNVQGSLNLLNVMICHNVRKMIFSSTAAVYGAQTISPITESSHLKPINPYGRTKLAVEFAIEDLLKKIDGQWITLRYFNAAGADPEAEIGEAHNPETHLIPLVIEAIYKQNSEINVFGDDYETIDGTCVRDYIHVSDLATGHVLALKYLELGGSSGTFNLGSGVGFSVHQIIDAVKRVTRRTARINVCPRRPGDPATLIASSDNARNILGWTPSHGSIEEIIETAWRWRLARESVLGY